MNILKQKKKVFQTAKFLATRQIRRGNKGISILIITILTLTFLSLVVIPGILTGLTEASFQQQREQLTGDLYLTTKQYKKNIENTQDIIRILDTIPEVKSYSVRYKTGIKITSGYIKRDDFTHDAENISIAAFAINPEKEDTTTSISNFIKEGEMLKNNESGYILIGSTLLKKYSKFSDLFDPLEYVKVGEPIRLTFTSGDRLSADSFKGGMDIPENPSSGKTAEFIVKGIINSKVGDVSSSVFITEQDYRRMTGKQSLQAQEIAIKHIEGISDDEFKKILLSYGIDSYAKVRTAKEAIPKFLSDVQNTFSLLGNMIGFIGLIVSSITVFIVIYINALTRRKFIGILKGIGISGFSIELSYLFQSVFYAIIGIGLGLLALYGFLVPFFLEHPIDFPMSDGILIADLGPTLVRAGILLLITMLAGYVPARLIVRKNTLDSILQR